MYAGSVLRGKRTPPLLPASHTVLGTQSDLKHYIIHVVLLALYLEHTTLASQCPCVHSCQCSHSVQPPQTDAFVPRSCSNQVAKGWGRSWVEFYCAHSCSMVLQGCQPFALLASKHTQPGGRNGSVKANTQHTLHTSTKAMQVVGAHFHSYPSVHILLPPPPLHTELHLPVHLGKYGIMHCLRQHLMLQKTLHIARRCNNNKGVATMLSHTEHSTLMRSHSLACCPTLLWKIFAHHVEQTHHTDQSSAPQPHSLTAPHPAHTLGGGSNKHSIECCAWYQ